VLVTPGFAETGAIRVTPARAAMEKAARNDWIRAIGEVSPLSNAYLEFNDDIHGYYTQENHFSNH
jgi:hypothetical protein